MWFEFMIIVVSFVSSGFSCAETVMSCNGRCFHAVCQCVYICITASGAFLRASILSFLPLQIATIKNILHKKSCFGT